MPWLLQIEDVYRWLKSALGRVSRFQPGLRDTVCGFLVSKRLLRVGHILRSLHERDRRPQSTYLVPGECEFAEFALVMKVDNLLFTSRLPLSGARDATKAALATFT